MDARCRGATLVGAIGAVAQRTLGGRPALVLLSSVAVAGAALLGQPSWRPVRAGRELRFGRAPLAVPWIAAAQVAGVRGQQVPEVLLLLFGGLAVVWLAVARPRATARAEALVHRGTTVVALALASLGLLVVALLLWIPGSIVGCWDRARRTRRSRRGATSWSVRSVGVAAARRDAIFPFASADGRSRRLQLTVGLALGLVVVSGLVVVIRSRPPERVPLAVSPQSSPADPSSVPGPVRGTPYDQLPAAAGLDYITELVREQQDLPLPPGPVGLYSIGDVTSRYTNVTDGARATVAPQPCGCPGSDVWFVGGSAAFGTGQRDDHTIASELVRLGDTDGLGLRVRNIAVPGYTLWQELQKVDDLLAGDEPRPDLIVFYVGFNDLAYTLAAAATGEVAWDQPVVSDFADLDRFRALEAADIPAALEEQGGLEHVGRRAGRRFAELRAVVRARLEGQGVAVEFAFQPDATGTATQLDAARGGDATLGGLRTESIADFLDAGASAASGSGDDLRGAFDAEPDPAFFDLVHTNERGALVAAQALFPFVAAKLRSGD